ncbi:MAG: hypothetical protein HY300_18840 [Verrucomicrobia bacterium]|nr:hypothetical protein [Verrucomicrobiota bacterium]
MILRCARRLVCFFILSAVVAHLRAADPTAKPARWWKGNLHTHSFWSDGDDFPDMIADWYRQNGYNFLGLSDHNTIQNSNRWMTVTGDRNRAQDLQRVQEPA